MNFLLFRQNLQHRNKLLCAWLLTLLLIPLLSLYGRSFQLFLLSHYSGATLGNYIGWLFFVLIATYTIVLFRAGLHPYVYNIIWIALLLFFLYQHLPYVEKMHIALFGLFGFLSQRLFILGIAFVGSILTSVLDEVFQHFLASRVGDIRDVAINLFSTFLGMFLAFLLVESARRKNVEKETKASDVQL